MTDAYSYIRFSTPAQSDGDSLRRQLAKAEKYAAKHGLNLDTTHRDLGLSGYKGINRVKGALRAFLDKVEGGEIARGCYLIVENLDRLTREDVLTAAALFLQIIDAGIIVVTLSDHMTYSRESILANPQELSISIGQFVRGNGESARKGEVLSDAWDEKRAALRTNPRKKLTRQGPGWLVLTPDDPEVDALVGEWDFTEKHASVIRAFELARDGLGKQPIANALIEEGHPTMKHGDGWQPSTVLYLLRDRRVLGEFQPMTNAGGKRRPSGEPIADYFPRAISDDLFYAVQTQLERRWTGASPARAGKVPNLFVGIARCECGRAMEYRDKRTKRSQGPNQVYLMCSGCRRSARICENSTRFTYHDVETHLLDWVTDIQINEEDVNRSTVAGIKLGAKKGQRDDLERRIANALTDHENETDPDFRSHFIARARALKIEQLTVEDEIVSLTTEVLNTKRSVVEDRRSAVQRARAEMASTGDEALFVLRAKLAAAIRQAIGRVIFYRDGRYSAGLNGGGKVYLFGKDGHIGLYRRIDYPKAAELAFVPGDAPALRSVATTKPLAAHLHLHTSSG